MTASLLAIYAHPDDEAFGGGTLIHYARLGVRVTLVCATRGEAGKVTDPDLLSADPTTNSTINSTTNPTTDPFTTLGRVREAELRRACEILEIGAPILLDYHDSGREERLRVGDSKALMNVDMLELETSLREVIAEVAPQVIITFDPHGGYGHPDHLAVQRAACAAFFSSGHLANPPQRLFYGVLPSETARLLGEARGLDPLLYGVSDETVAVRLDVRAYLEQKVAARLAHRTQALPSAEGGDTDKDDGARMRELMERMFSFEHHALGGMRGPLPSYPSRGLFDGLGLDII